MTEQLTPEKLAKETELLLIENERLFNEAKKSEQAVTFTHEWYAERIARIEELAKEKGIWNEVACILANGTISSTEPPTYSILLNEAKYRAEQAEAQLKEKDGALLALRELVIELTGYGSPSWASGSYLDKTIHETLTNTTQQAQAAEARVWNDAVEACEAELKFASDGIYPVGRLQNLKKEV